MRKSIIAAAVILMAAFLFPPSAVAQQPPLSAQLPQGFQSDPYVLELMQTIRLWNDRDLRLPSRDAVVAQLQARVQSVAVIQRYAYQTDAWGQALVKRATELPPTVEPRATVSDPAALVLASLFIKGLDEVKSEVPLSELRSTLEPPLFLILGRAQQLTDQAQIDAGTMLRAVFSWWTGVWPFCDR